MRKDWLHFYQMDFIKQSSNYPKIINRGEGCYVFDANEKSYFDALSGAFCMNLGYGQKDLLAASHQAMQKLSFASPFSVGHPLAIELAEKISDSLQPVFGEDAQVFFSNSGSEAIDAALKIALAIFRKRGENRKFFISMDNSYHGTTFGAASISGYAGCRSQTGNLYKEVLFAPDGVSYLTEGCKKLDQFLQELPISPSEIAGWIIEPVENNAGNNPVSHDFINTIANFCKKHGILLIVDEVITGFGRLGQQWGIESYPVRPDILVSAKGLTAGHESLGATAIRKELELLFRGDDTQCFMHGATYGGRPSACGVANKVFDLQNQLNIFDQVKENSQLIENHLQAFQSEFSFIERFSGKGFLWSIHFTSYLDELQFNEHISEKLCLLGVLPALYQTRKSQALEFAPPLITSSAKLQQVLDTYNQVFFELSKLALELPQQKTSQI